MGLWTLVAGVLALRWKSVMVRERVRVCPRVITSFQGAS